MNGNVYVFNVFSETLNLATNGNEAGSLPGWSTGNPRYQPSSIPVARTLNASDGPGKFFNGRNDLVLQWDDGLFTASVLVNGSMIPLNQDLLLFLARTQWELVSQYGEVLQTGPVLPMQAIA